MTKAHQGYVNIIKLKTYFISASCQGDILFSFSLTQCTKITLKNKIMTKTQISITKIKKKLLHWWQL